jgi:hypothetical protein
MTGVAVQALNRSGAARPDEPGDERERYQRPYRAGGGPRHRGRFAYMLGFAPETRTDGPAVRRIEVKVSASGQGRLHVSPAVKLRRGRTDTVSGRHRAARLVAQTLFTAGLLVLGYAAYVVIDAKAYQAIERRRFEQTRPDAAPAPATIEGSPIGEIQIPRLGLRAVVAQGDSPAVPQRAVGHLGHTQTLITCFPFSYIGPAPDRIIVRALETRGRP